MIDLLAIQPHKISTDLSSYATLIYGNEKAGKTTFMHELFGDDMLLVATEKGYLARAGVNAVDVPRWKEFTDVIRQLKKPEVKARFKVIVFDTADLLYDMAVKHILLVNGIDKLGDIPFGGGYKMVDDLFKDALLEIQGMGYGLGFISHSVMEVNEDTGVTKFRPSVNKRGGAIINKMVDTIGFAYLKEVDGEEKRTLYLRETLNFKAGCRFRFVAPAIPLDAKVFQEEIAKAIAKEGEMDANSVTDVKANRVQFEEELNFEELMNDLRGMALKFKEAEQLPHYTKVIENHLGKERKVSELVAGQEEIMSIILDELAEISKELGI